jgi:hypothetical protein
MFIEAMYPRSTFTKYSTFLRVKFQVSQTFFKVMMTF